jgi:hypothetical protein
LFLELEEEENENSEGKKEDEGTTIFCAGCLASSF